MGTEREGQETSQEQPGTHRSISLFTCVGEKANVPSVVCGQVRPQHSRGEQQNPRLQGFTGERAQRSDLETQAQGTGASTVNKIQSTKIKAY